MGIADGTGFNTRVKQFTDALIATHLQGPDAYSRLAATAQGQDPLAWAVAVDTFKKLSASSANQQAMQQGQQGPQPPVLAQRAMQERGLAGMPTSQEMFDPRLHAQGIGAVEEPTGPVARAAGGGIIAFAEGGLQPWEMAEAEESALREKPKEKPSATKEKFFTEAEARQRAEAAAEARRAAQMGLPRPSSGVPAALPDVPASAGQKALTMLKGVGRGLGRLAGPVGAAYTGYEVGSALEPVARSTGVVDAVTGAAEDIRNLFPGSPFRAVEAITEPTGKRPKTAPAAPPGAPAPTAYDKVSEISKRQTTSPLPDQMPYVNVVQGAELLAALPDAARNGMLKNARDTGLKEFTVNYPGANGELVKGTVVLGEPKQQTEAPAVERAKPAAPAVDLNEAFERSLLQSLTTKTPQQQTAADNANRKLWDEQKKAEYVKNNIDPDMYKKQLVELSNQAKQAEKDRDFDRWMSFAQGFATMAAGTSPYFAVNFGQGLGVTATQLKAAQKDFREADIARRKSELAIRLAERAEVDKDFEGREKFVETARKEEETARAHSLTALTSLTNNRNTKEYLRQLAEGRLDVLRETLKQREKEAEDRKAAAADRNATFALAELEREKTGISTKYDTFQRQLNAAKTDEVRDKLLMSPVGVAYSKEMRDIDNRRAAILAARDKALGIDTPAPANDLSAAIAAELKRRQAGGQ